MTNENLAEYLFELVRINVFGSDSNKYATALKNRFIGFRAELDYLSFRKKRNQKQINGGYFLPLRDRKATLSAPVYFTIDTVESDQYKNLYSSIDKMDLAKLLYLQYFKKENTDSWQLIDVMGFDYKFPIPEFIVFDYQRNTFVKLGDLSFFTSLFSNKKRERQNISPSKEVKQFCLELITSFKKEDLIDLYVNRLVFDGFLGFGVHKGLPSDIDLIAWNGENNFRFIEIKEKDKSKNKPIGFGIDVQRLNDILAIAETTQQPYAYVVRHVNNQKERNFIEWRWIEFKDFIDKCDQTLVRQGGTGMNTAGNGDNPTVLVEEKHFKAIPKIET